MGDVPPGYFCITYSSLLDNALAQWLWRRFFCEGGWHLYDEVLSPTAHYLSCDACGSHVRLGGDR
ncbi:hypothetical protein LCGC14_2193870 [marine sediment metagenome]|uniref:Uncharacterized protein n=1 Tax=marine sediment metagenome TaxID=412755 RepID=A0A0F9DIR8_9ZZZZ